MSNDEQAYAHSLVTRIFRGDAAAEEEYVRRYSAEVTRLLRRCLGDRDSAEDLHQETFRILIARLRRKPIARPSELRAFTSATARTLATVHWRRRSRIRSFVTLDESLHDSSPDPFERLEAAERARVLRRAVARVKPVRYRVLLERLYFSDEPRAAVAASVQLTPQQFDRVLHRARTRLKETLLRMMERP